MMPDLLLVMVLGFVFLSVFGIVLARRMAMAAFSLFALTVALALVYAILSLSMAFVAQLILYVGGVMVLILFALFLYGDPLTANPWVSHRTNFLKAFFLIGFIGISAVYLPWQNLYLWISTKPVAEAALNDSGISETGSFLATTYVVEFEVLGLLLLASLLVAGWFVHSHNQSSKL
ncbi:MAG TPA: NADH-quinone oxidoreductase subunit J [Catalimonadaceae bacterium]|jgi:NADH:ubiquinone oxidoreductase subunit 6 (subunit J)|nr:NADH-quinone oxidoreductase subunit J [Catalimonadaceae bacterium]